jgi:hypothetical protein
MPRSKLEKFLKKKKLRFQPSVVYRLEKLSQGSVLLFQTGEEALGVA